MRVPKHLVEARRQKLARMLQQLGYLPLAELCQRLEISEATARRDLASLEKAGRVTRTYGGAVVEPLQRRFATFKERQNRATDAKRRIAMQARRMIEPGFTVYLDVGTTMFAVTELLHEQPIRPLTIVTSSLPIVEILAGIEGVRIHLLGGELLPGQSALIGVMARRVLPMWTFDVALLSAEGMNRKGIWNTQKDIVLHQRAVMRRAKRSVFCIDGTKLGERAAELLMPWNTSIYLLTDASRGELRAAGVKLHPEQLISA